MHRFLVYIGICATCAMLSACAREPEDAIARLVKPGPVFLLGFDGLDPGLVARYLDEGILPNFARLRDAGATGAVRSTVPMISPPAWTSVATGTNPGDHGVWGFWIPEGDNPRGRYVDATCRLAPAIWEDLTASGLTSGIVNVPITCPPDSVNGFMIAGFPYPKDAPLTWPAKLEKKIVEKGYLRDALAGPPQPGKEQAWLEHTLAVGRARRKIGLEMLFKERPDLSFIVFTTPDRIQHHLWRFHDPKHPLYQANASAELKNAVQGVYEWCDEILGEVLGKLPDNATLFVLSDHGFGPAYRGVSKARLLAELPGKQGELAVSTRNLFGGDFYLEGATDAERADFVKALEAATDDSGKPLTRVVHNVRSRETYGYALELGPSVVAEEAEGDLFIPGTVDGPLVSGLAPTSFSGYHRRRGFFAAWGGPVVQGPVRDIDLTDVPAMTMHILGQKIPRRYFHNVPRRLFPLMYFVYRPMETVGFTQTGLRRPGQGSTISDADRRDVEEQLKSIGYVQ